MTLKFNNWVLVQQKSSLLHSNFVLNLYIVYELNNWPRNPTNNYTLKNYLFGTVKLTRNADKSKFNYNGQIIVFDKKDIWCYGNNFARNAAIFYIDNTSSSLTKNTKIKFLGLGEEPTKRINDSVCIVEKKLVLTLVKQRQYIVYFCVTTVLIVICVQIKQRFINLGCLTTYIVQLKKKIYLVFMNV